MKFDIITIFPKILDSYLNESILKRAQKRKLIQVKIHNLRDYTTDKHKTVDDKPYGGGAGMVLMAEPITKAVDQIKNQKKSQKTRVVLFSAKGKPFEQKTAYSWAKKYERIVFITGRYEGIDERVKKILKAEEISIGPYVLSDGDIAALVVISAVSRLLPGVIKLESLREESHESTFVKTENRAPRDRNLEYPHYTRPEVITYRGATYRVPKILLSGNHQKIYQWRQKQQKKI